MKAKEILYLLGLRPSIKKYGTRRESFVLPTDGRIEYAQWLHPKDYKKVFSQAAVDELRQFIAPGDVCIDVGAHGGDSALPLALAAGPQGCVLAFEPNPYVFHVLEENAALNTDKMRIIAFPFAATIADENIQFEYSDSGFCNGGRHEGVSRWTHGHAFNLTVPGRNIERLISQQHPDLLDRITYIKTDAEGYDAYVLQSMRGLIEKNRPYIQSEIYKLMPQDQRIMLVEMMRELDYQVKRVDDHLDSASAPRVTIDNVMKWPNYDVFCQPAEKVVPADLRNKLVANSR